MSIYFYSVHSNKYHEKLEELVSKLRGWKSEILFNLAEKKEDKEDYIDICGILDGEKPCILPPHYRGLSSKSKVITDLKLCAMKSGFCLVHR